ncbi:acetyl-CoA synthetase-like protein [Trametes meyenii]|nr:acetyl-CoA synthetase-like protein [Trametes meyenii]
MHFKSPYPPLPPIPLQNAHQVIFSSPALQTNEDQLLFLEPLTGKQWSKRDFRQRVYDCTTALLTPVAEGGLGFDPSQEMVAIMSINCLEYLILVHSLFRAAIPFALIPAQSTAFELEHLLRTAGVTRILVHPTLLSQALNIAPRVRLSTDHIYVLDGHTEGQRDLDNAIEAIRKRHAPQAPCKPVMSDTLAYLVFSSGTSGLPKAVMISHRNIIVSLEQVITGNAAAAPNSQLQMPEPIALGFMPLYHSYGLHVVGIRTVWYALKTLVIPKWDADVVLDLIPRYRVSVLYLTPPAILQLVNHPRIREADLSSLLLTGSGAAHLPPKLAKTFKDILPNPAASVSEGYGMSEVTIAAIRTPPEAFGGPKPGSTGVLIPGMEAKIVKEDGSLAGPNEPGELWLSGGNVAMGYWRNPDATRATFVDGWVRTGDCFRVDADQCFFFVERTKDVLKVSGAQVSPTELENALLAHPGGFIRDVAVAGVLGGRTSDEKVPRAWVVLSDEGKRRPEGEVIEALHGWAKESLSKHKWLRGGIEVVDEIPKNPTGKVLRRVLQSRHEQQLADKSRAKL